MEGNKRMIRQCAWCLRIINKFGEHLSQCPVPKEYNATHGMCLPCAVLWLKQAMVESGDEVNPLLIRTSSNTDVGCYL